MPALLANHSEGKATMSPHDGPVVRLAISGTLSGHDDSIVSFTIAATSFNTERCT